MGYDVCTEGTFYGPAEMFEKVLSGVEHKKEKTENGIEFSFITPVLPIQLFVELDKVGIVRGNSTGDDSAYFSWTNGSDEKGCGIGIMVLTETSEGPGNTVLGLYNKGTYKEISV